ncbi:MAG: DoxX family protein [Minwuia sp.]|nr:DoxX family protein [Minwuia sp.]
MSALYPIAELVGRILLSIMFVLAGLNKLGNMEGTAGYMSSAGVPGELVIPVIITELGFGLLLLVGFMTRLMAFLLGGFTVFAALLFHLDFGDQMQTILFMKNLAIAGGLGIIFANGAGPLSIDGLRRR